MKKIFIIVALVAGLMVSAQVKIGDNVGSINTNSILELESSNKGVLFPRVTLTGTTDATTVGTQIAGMTVYNTATTSDVTPGMYTSNGTKWVRLEKPDYQNIRGNVTTVTTSTYTVSATDQLINTNPSSGSVTITFPALTNTAADIGRIVYVFNNNNDTLALTYVGVVGGSTVTNKQRGRIFIWTGTQWVNIGL